MDFVHEGSNSMEKSENRKRRWFLFFIGGAMLVTLALGIIFQLSLVLITVLLLFLGMIFAAVWLWYQANLQASGDEWWQDDEASGWRGY